MLSIIIPTLNEAGFIGRLISQIEAQQTSAEVIVVDGGSTDQTVAEVRSLLNVKFFESEPGRAAQMNLGAKNANGDVLLFLHADSQVDKLLLSGLENALTNGDANAGSFAMQFEESNTWLKLYARFTLHNTRLLTFGDQGLFVKAALFHEIGGFKDIPFLEDVEIQNRLRKSGKFIKLKTPITCLLYTSPSPRDA